MTELRTILGNENHTKLREILLDVAKLASKDMPVDQILAVFAHVTGQLIALQDGNKITKDMVRRLVDGNITKGTTDMQNSLEGKSAGRTQ